MTVQPVGDEVMVTPIRLPNCQKCGREVYLPAEHITLHLDNTGGGHTYVWNCPYCNAVNTREAHDFVIDKLKDAGVKVVEAADQFAFDLQDDDAIALEMDGMTGMGEP